jgi:hypothetical protein
LVTHQDQQATQQTQKTDGFELVHLPFTPSNI